MKNDSVLRNRYLDQYKDIYGENIYLSAIDLVEDNISALKGGSELTAFYHLIKDCKDCNHGNSKIDLGVGNENANIVFIAEAKCTRDEKHNNSLDGEAGELFDKILSAIKLSREDVYISDMLKHIPSENSDSQQTDNKICEAHFQQHLQIINPSLVVALGEDVGNKILKVNESIKDLNGKIHELENFNLMVTYHPDAIVKNPKLKQATWEDFKKIRDNYLS
ncbi:MAG: uracil-DNA glycosylase [Candidatus Marinimicrobia bacterium]|nr:uracil-DNA glycosylase [Candidatus Neomarinimicrobiota bacterium]